MFGQNPHLGAVFCRQYPHHCFELHKKSPPRTRVLLHSKSYPANKDRVGIKGGDVAIYVKMVKWENVEEEHIESKWITVRPKKLPGEIHILIVGAIYHPPKNDNLAGQFAMILHIQTSLEQMFQKQS